LSKGGYGIFHEGESIQVEGIKGGAQQTPFDTQIARANSELSKGIVGVTMTADDGSSKSQSETHMQIHDDVIEAVKRKVTVAVMNRLIPKLMMRGLDFKNRRFEYVEQKDLTALFDRAIKLLDTEEYDIEPKFINDTFGIPVTKRIKAPVTNPNVPQPDDPEPDPEDPLDPPAPKKKPAKKAAAKKASE
jgi:phage gp29-like protein